MTLNLLLWGGGLLILGAAGLLARFISTESRQMPSDVSGDWLARARTKEEDRW